MSRAVQAQAQAVRERQLYATESAELVKCLLKISIYHVTYLRGLFPDDCYKSINMNHLDGLNVMMLNEKDKEGYQIVQWMEGGVTDALKHRYLRKLFFGISRDPDGKELLEEYVFSFSYDENGVAMRLGGRAGSKRAEVRTSVTDDMGRIKYETCRLIRMLVTITQSLEQVPSERYIFMKITYYDNTPADYEPPMFEPAPDGGVGRFCRKPFNMGVGRVNTPHHQVALQIKSVLDNMDMAEVGDQVPEADDGSNICDCTTTMGATSHRVAASAGTCVSQDNSMGGCYSRAGPLGAHKLETRLEDLYTELQPEAGEGGDSGSPAAGSEGRLSQYEEELQAARRWVLARPSASVHLLDALAKFGRLPISVVEAFFNSLKQEGVLVATEQADEYRVVAPAATAPACASPGVAAAEAAMEKLTVAPAAVLPAAPSQLPEDSMRGGVWQAPGTQRTESVAGRGPPMGPSGAAAAQALAPPSQQPAEQVWMETQPSQVGGVRKASMALLVQDPKRQRRSQSAVSQSMLPSRMQLRSRN